MQKNQALMLSCIGQQLQKQTMQVLKSNVQKMVLTLQRLAILLPEGSVNTIHQYAYTDYSAMQGKQYYYRIKQVDQDWTFRLFKYRIGRYGQ